MLATLKVYYLLLRAKLGEQHGQDVMEYALLTGGIALAVAAVLLIPGFTGQLQTFADTIGNCVAVGASYHCP